MPAANTARPDDTALERLAALVESSEDAIIGKSVHGIVESWNPAANRIYGYTAAEMIGRSMTLLLPPDRADEETEILARIIRGERVDHFETVRRRKDGRDIHVSLTISPIRDKAGAILGASHIGRDITERREFELQLQQTQKLESLGVMAGGVAHDFNNLLVGILGNAGMLQESLADFSEDRRLADDIANAAERAAALTRQLLAYAGKGRFILEPVDFSVLTREIGRLIESSIPKTVEVTFDLKPDLPAIEADSGQIQQVIMNLVINAAEAIGENPGTVVVATGLQIVDEKYIRTIWGKEELRTGKYVSLEVSDNGSGMDEATVGRIFDPFFTTKFAGRGLGLAAVLGIVRGHRGALKVDSSPGKGSTFKLLFPVMIGALPAPARQSIPADLSGSGTILIVDDEEMVRRTARYALERLGYRVLLANNGAEAVSILHRSGVEIALVLLDLTMPGMNGEETFERIKMIQPSLPVLLSSGFNEVTAIRRFSGNGLAGFIQKPYTVARLGERVKALARPT